MTWTRDDFLNDGRQLFAKLSYLLRFRIDRFGFQGVSNGGGLLVASDSRELYTLQLKPTQPVTVCPTEFGRVAVPEAQDC